MRLPLTLLAVILLSGLPATGDPNKDAVDTNVSTTAPKPEVVWYQDYRKGLEVARKENRFLLLNFSGSDWCGWCKTTQREVFATCEFQDFAKDRLVLVTVDFPRHKQLPEDLRMVNDELRLRYRVSGFPTFVIVGLDERARWVGGYVPGGPIPLLQAIVPVLTGRP